MNKSNKGQASIELMVVLGVLLMIFMILGYIVYRNYVKSNDLKLYIFGTRLANHIADHINAVNAVGDGYSTTFDVPGTLYGNRNYTIDFYRNESSVFVEGGAFSSGSDLKYSSPIATSRVRCIMPKCNYSCNTTDYVDCLKVDNQMTIRIVRYDGGIYMTPESNARQGQTYAYINPYDGVGEADPGTPESQVTEGADADGKWNVIYVRHNTVNGTLSLVFSLNITNNEIANIRLNNVIGDIVEVKSDDGGVNPEFNLAALPPGGFWIGNTTGDIDGGTIVFRGGFHACIVPDRTKMPSQDWILLSSDGNHINLDKTTEVCVNYP